MKLSKTFYLLVCSLFLALNFSCNNKTKKAGPDLSSINLLRGELLLCGSQSFGKVDFSQSCSAETRETFDLAISLLHSFEYDEAEKAFVQVIDKDPNCAMAYWGVSMSIFHSLWMQSDLSYLDKGQKLLKIASTLTNTEKEKDYIDAIGAYYADWKTVDVNTRKLNYEKKMEAMYNKYPEDTEVTVFYALSICAAADPKDKSYSRQLKSGKILEALLTKNPNHPGIAHYIIHNYDYPELASKALTTARSYAKIAPSSAHAQHMPSHIFTRLGLWDESINSNLNSASAASCYAENANTKSTWSQEIHAIDYLVYAYLQKGDNEKANLELKKIQLIKEVFPKNDFGSSYALVAIPVRIALENKQWEKAAKLELPSIDFPWEKLSWQAGMLHFAKALGAVHIGDLESAKKEMEVLKKGRQTLIDSNDKYKAGQVMIQIKAVEAWIEWAKGNNEVALKLMKESATLESQTSKHPVTPGEVLPADELLGDLLMAMNKPKEAFAVYELDLKGHPNRFNALYGAAKAAEKSGQSLKAQEYFQKLIQVCKNTKSDRPEIKEAIAYLNKKIAA